MLTINKKEQMQKRFIFFSCLLIALWFGITPVWASGIEELLTSIIASCINFLCSLILYLIQTIANVFLNVMAIDLTALQGIGFLGAFSNFTGLIAVIATGLAALFVMFQIFGILIGPFTGAKQMQSIGVTVSKALIFIPLTYLSQTIALFTLGLFQDVYTSVLIGYKSIIGLAADAPLVMKDIAGSLDGIKGTIAPGTGILTGIVQGLIASLLLIVILWNFVKLLLEMTQRFVAMLVYSYLSPLAVACGVGANSISITKQAVTLFMSSGVLWILNVWSVGIILSLLAVLDNAVLGGTSAIFVWALLTYGFLKIAQQLDDIFKAVGATNVAFSGSMLDDIMSVSKLAENVGNAMQGMKTSMRNFSENGFFGMKGNSADNPTMPGATKINDKSKATAADKQSTQNSGPKTFGQQAKAWASGTMGGMAVRGLMQTAKNVQQRVDNHNAAAATATNAKSLSAFSNAMSKPSQSQRMEAMNNLVKANPNVLKNNTVKEQVADTLGLKENQSITGLSVNDQGRLSATVATKNANGSVGLSTVNGLNDTSKKEITTGADSAEPNKASYRANQLASAGSTNATMTLRDPDGSELSAGISKATGSNSSVNGVSDFSVMPSGGSSPINVKAPSDMSAEDVGSIIAGTASKEMMQKFERGGGDVSAAMSALNINPESVGSVASSSAWIDDARTSVHLSNSALDDNSGISLQRSSSSPDGDTWTASNHNGENIGSFSVASGTGAREIASTVMSSDGELYDNLRSNGGIERNSNSTEASFVSNTVDTSIGGFGTSDNFSASINDSTGSGQFKYQYASSDGATYESNGFITPSGNVENGKMEYQYGKDGTASGSVYINANISPEDLVAALAHGEGRGIDGIKEIREKLGISTKYSDAETNQVKSLLQKVKDGDTSSENAPVGKHQ